MLDIEIKIKGAGITISNEIYLIEKILKEHGYEVHVNDEHPPKKEIDLDKVEGKQRKINIVAIHLPWGG